MENDFIGNAIDRTPDLEAREKKQERIIDEEAKRIIKEIFKEGIIDKNRITEYFREKKGSDSLIAILRKLSEYTPDEIRAILTDNNGTIVEDEGIGEL